jgi:hypothetical protein
MALPIPKNTEKEAARKKARFYRRQQGTDEKEEGQEQAAEQEMLVRARMDLSASEVPSQVHPRKARPAEVFGPTTLSMVGERFRSSRHHRAGARSNDLGRKDRSG